MKSLGLMLASSLSLLARDAAAQEGAGATATKPASAQPDPGGRVPERSPVSGSTGWQDHEAGLALLRQGKAEDAVVLLRSAVEKEPASAAFTTDLGFALGRLGRRDEAEQALRTAIRLDPRRWYAYANLAEILVGDQSRWDRRDEIMALLASGLERADDANARANLALRVADFERSVGRTGAARARLAGLAGARIAPAIRKRVLDLEQRIAADEQARALVDWPAPDPPAPDRRALAAAAATLERGRSGDALEALHAADVLAAAWPAWAEALWLRARALAKLGRTDDEERELTVLTRLSPSHALAWRRLGILLAGRGGALEAERADEALRHALALEPSWADLRALRDRLAARRGRKPAAPARADANEPSAKARALFRQAEDEIAAGDPVGLASDFLAKVLGDSPGFVEAAATQFSITGSVPDRTVRALWDDAARLLALAVKVRALAKDAAGRALARPWLDRAIELGADEARFERAAARADEKDAAGALADLTDYVARTPDPARLEEARALRASLEPAGRTPVSGEAMARLRLIDGEPREARELLGGRCVPALAPARLVALGAVYEFEGRAKEALDCHAMAVRRAGAPDDPEARAARERIARIGGWADPTLVRGFRAELAAAAGPAADFATARLLAADGAEPRALEAADRFLAAAPPDDPAVPEATRLRDRLRRTRSQADARRTREAMLAAFLAAGSVLVIVFAALRGATVARALAARPGLYPEVARAIAEIRHDVLKHRASVIGVLTGDGAAASDATDPARRGEVARALRQPEPTSAVVARIYRRVRDAARGQGITLRPLGREPTFGPLARDLERAEAWAGRPGRRDRLRRIDEALRGLHVERLAALLRLGPRTRIGAAEISTWIHDVEAEVRQNGGGWAPPALALADAGLDFPVERDALAVVFSNLLRNAEAAAARRPGGAVGIGIEDERDAAGRRLLVLRVADSATEALTLEAIEARESGRGLAIVRDLVRHWRGHLTIRPEPAPYAKSISACFPA